MLVCDQPAFAIVRPTKTATSSVSHWLGRRLPIRNAVEKHEVGRQQVYYYHDWILLTRSPYSRVVSLWLYFEPDLTFSAFLQSPVFLARQHGWLRPISRWRLLMPRVDYLVRLERLASDLLAIPHFSDFPPPPWLNISHSRRDDWWSFYSDEDKQIVADVYAEDFLLDGYDVDFDKNVAFCAEAPKCPHPVITWVPGVSKPAPPPGPSKVEG